MVNININIPDDKKEIIKAFKALIDAFKNDIEVEEKENKIVHSLDMKHSEISPSAKKNNKLEEFKKIVGSIKVERVPTIQERNDIRASRYVQ